MPIQYSIEWVLGDARARQPEIKTSKASRERIRQAGNHDLRTKRMEGSWTRGDVVEQKDATYRAWQTCEHIARHFMLHRQATTLVRDAFHQTHGMHKPWRRSNSFQKHQQD